MSLAEDVPTCGSIKLDPQEQLAVELYGQPGYIVAVVQFIYICFLHYTHKLKFDI